MSRIIENLRHSPIGWIPKEWHLKKLSSLATISYGISDPIDKNLDQGIPMIGMPNVTKGGAFKWDERFYIRPEKVMEKDFLKFGDILFNWRNGSKDHLGKTVLYNLMGKYTHVGFLLKIRCKNSLDPTYCDLYIKGIKDRGYFLKAKIQVNNTFNKEELSSLPIVFPPLVEQQKIAKILSTWDKAIEKLEALIAAKQKRKNALLQQILTGKKRFAEFVKSEGIHKTKFGTIPSDWQYLHIADVAKQFSAKNNAGHDLPVLSCTKHYGLVDSLSYFGKQIFSEDTSTYKVVPRNAFAYATNHIEEGSIGYQNLYDKALISPMYTVFQTNENINDEFLYRLLKTELYRHIFEVNTSASVDRRGSLRWDQFAAIKIPVPSIPEQQKIALFFAVTDKEIETHQKQLTALKEQKKGLMQQLLTGKKRVQTEMEV